MDFPGASLAAAPTPPVTERARVVKSFTIALVSCYDLFTFFVIFTARLTVPWPLRHPRVSAGWRLLAQLQTTWHISPRGRYNDRLRHERPKLASRKLRRWQNAMVTRFPNNSPTISSVNQPGWNTWNRNAYSNPFVFPTLLVDLEPNTLHHFLEQRCVDEKLEPHKLQMWHLVEFEREMVTILIQTENIPRT